MSNFELEEVFPHAEPLAGTTLCCLVTKAHVRFSYCDNCGAARGCQSGECNSLVFRVLCRFFALSLGQRCTCVTRR